MAATSPLRIRKIDFSSELTLLDCILDALKATNRTIRTGPHPSLPPHFTAENLATFKLKKLPDGWVANICFRDVPPGEPDALGTFIARPFKTAQEAFLAGAGLFCAVFTGSHKLPFTIVDGQLAVATS